MDLEEPKKRGAFVRMASETPMGMVLELAVVVIATSLCFMRYENRAHLGMCPVMGNMRSSAAPIRFRTVGNQSPSPMTNHRYRHNGCEEVRLSNDPLIPPRRHGRVCRQAGTRQRSVCRRSG